MDFSNFFPSYVPIDSNNFYQDIYEMKEFHDLASAGKMDGFYHHQMFPARFLSPWTSLYYNSLFLIHDTGTGKSASIAALLNITKTYNPSARMLYLTRNDVLISNFKKELLKLCPYIQNKIKEADGRYDENKDLVFRHEKIDFATFSAFANRIEGKDTRSSLYAKYNNAIIVCDEAHHIVSDKLTTYNSIDRFFTNLPRKRILLSTATPMRDSLLEAVLLLNLMLPMDKKFITGDAFVKKYLRQIERTELQRFSQEKLFQYEWKTDTLQNEFKDKIKGYISVYRQKPDNIPIQYIGKRIQPLLYTVIYEDYMSDFQSKTYQKALEKDIRVNRDEQVKQVEQYSNFYLNSLQASLMVFPNETYGPEAKKYFEQIKGKQKIYDRFNPIFFEETGMSPQKSNKDNLTILKKYSEIYYNVIRELVNPENEDKCFYIYSDKINGSGILRLINLLTQVFHYNLFRGRTLSFEDSNKGKRCLYLNEKAGQNVDITKQLEVFNSYENRHGEFIRVVFGTDRTREGITIKNVQQMHILTPSWNFGKKNQAEGRGIRLNSHNDLENPKVDIFLHCALTRKSPLYSSVNFLQYVRSEVKEKNNFLFSYAFLTAATDCQINYYNNFHLAEDYSASCYFQKCKYECDGINKVNIPPDKINTSNFNYFYLLSTVDKIMPTLSSLLVRNMTKVISLQELRQVLRNQNITDLILFEALNFIIDQPILIKNPFQLSLFLCRNNDLFFVSASKNTSQNNGILVGTTNVLPVFNFTNNIDDLRYNVFQKFFPEKLQTLKTLLQENKITQAKHFFHSFPSSLKQLLETTLPASFLSLLTETSPTPNVTEKNVIDLQNPAIKKYKFYAIIEKDKFKLRDVSDDEIRTSNKSKTKGENCKTVQVDKIIQYIIRILNEDNSRSIDQRLQAITNLVPSKSITLNENLSKVKKMSDEEIRQYITDYGKEWSKLYPEGYPFSLSEMKYYAYLKVLNQRRQILCSFLFQLMKNVSLLF